MGVYVLVKLEAALFAATMIGAAAMEMVKVQALVNTVVTLMSTKVVNLVEPTAISVLVLPPVLAVFPDLVLVKP